MVISREYFAESRTRCTRAGLVGPSLSTTPRRKLLELVVAEQCRRLHQIRLREPCESGLVTRSAKRVSLVSSSSPLVS